ncbi:MAG: transporter [Sphingobacteriales bacterium]|nr:MAG: transporter [Sphingobacteriales bacterium]
MKKIWILMAMMLLQSAMVQACDICGCGAGSAYLGILPDFNSRIVGIRYRFNEVQTHVGPGGTPTYLTTNEGYHTAELWAGYTFGKKIRVMAYLPVSYNTKVSQEENRSKSGLGDAGAQAFYHVLNNRKTLGKRLLVQDLWLGGGIKLPTGKYEPRDNESAAQSANLFQLGTGSFDFLLTAMYDLRLQDAGLNISASYKMNTANRYDYNYGNKISANTQLYYKFNFARVLTISPNAGAGYERSAQDLDQEYGVFNSGGYVLFGTVGAELNYKKFAAGGNWQPPLAQDLAAGVVKARHRMMVHVAVMF